MLALDWQAPAACPDGAEVTARVEELVGHLPPERHTFVARGRIELAGTYRLDLAVGDGHAARVLTDVDCARLGEAAAIILALDIDPEALSRPPTPPRPEPEHPAPFVPPSPRPRTRPTPAPATRETHGALGARIVLDVGSLPRPTAAVAIGLDLARGPVVIAVAGTAYGERFTTDGPRGGSAGAYVDLTTLSALACVRHRFGVAAGAGCLGVELGREGTRGVGIARPETSASLWGAALAMLRVRVWPGRPIAPAGGLGLAVPVADPDVVIGGAGTVFKPSSVAFRVYVGIEGDFF